MLSGNKPHAGDGRHELLDARQKAPPRLRTGQKSDIPSALAEVVASLLVDLHKKQETILIVVTHSAELAGRLPIQFELHEQGLVRT